MNQMWILKSSKDHLEYIESRSLSSYNNIKTFDFSSVYATFHHSKLIDRLKPSVHLWFIKQNAQRRYKCIVLGRDTSYFVKVTAPILPKSSLKLISSKCSSFWLTTYLLCLVDVFFNRQSAYTWVQTVLLFSPTCSFIYMRHTWYRCFPRKTKRS